MNILEGHCVAEGVVEVEGRSLPIAKAIMLTVGQRVKIGIRPEHLFAETDGFLVCVDLIEALGASQIIHATVGSQAMTLHVETDSLPIEAGQQAVVGCEPHHIHVFDAQTGRRLSEKDFK